MRHRFLQIKLIIFLWACVALCPYGIAQPEPVLKFHTDSIQLGEPVWVSLSFTHLPNVEFVFPDSSYDFSPFEYIDKVFFNTVTDSLSRDSVVYKLAVYDVEPVFRLSLPVIIYSNGDTLYTFSNESYIALKEVVNSEESAKKGLLLNVNQVDMHYAFDVVLFSIVFGSFALILLLVFVFFRKRIISWYKIKQLNRQYALFESASNRLEPLILAQRNVQAAEEFVKTWKIFLEKTDTKSFSTMTTKEIAVEFGLNQVTSALQNFDRAIYGARMVENLQTSLEYLKQGARQRYIEQKNKLQNERN